MAIAEHGRRDEAGFFGTIKHSGDAVLRLTKHLVAGGKVPTFCYEAGPCGYGLHRMPTKLGFECAAVSPAMIPRKAGDRIETDCRDALMPARLWRAGELTPIWAMDALKAAKQQLQSFLLRHGLPYRNGKYWTIRHRRWLAEPVSIPSGSNARLKN